MSVEKLNILLPGNAELINSKPIRGITSDSNSVIKAIKIAKNWALPMAVIVNNNKIVGAGTGGTSQFAFVKAFKASKAFLTERETIVVFNKFIGADTAECIEENMKGKIVIVTPEFDSFGAQQGKNGYEDFNLLMLERSILFRLNWNGKTPKYGVADFEKSIKTATIKDPDRDEIATIEFASYIGAHFSPSVIFASALHTCCIIGEDEEVKERMVRENMTWEDHLVVYSSFPFTGLEMDILKKLDVTAIAQSGAVDDFVIKAANRYNMSVSQCHEINL